MLHSEKKLAVLIDAENTQLSALEAIMTELAKYGYVIVKRAYGDWASSGLKNWKNTLNELAIQPMQQFSYTQGKNSSQQRRNSGKKNSPPDAPSKSSSAMSACSNAGSKKATKQSEKWSNQTCASSSQSQKNTRTVASLFSTSYKKATWAS